MNETKASALRLASQSWVFGILFFAYDYSTLLPATGNRRMLSPVPLTSLILSQLADILVVALLYAGIVAVLRRFTSWRYTQWLAVGLTTLILAVRLRPFFPEIPHFRYHSRLIGMVVITIILYTAITKFPDALRRSKAIAGTFFAGFSIFAILVSGELLRIAFWRPAPISYSRPAAFPEDSSRPRLIWIVFDELDYYQTFGHRDASLQLPNFDRLRGQSILYSNVPPIQKRTFEAVSSFLSGTVISKIRYTWDNRLQVLPQNGGGWQPFPVQNTVFAAAHQAGLRSAIVGWAIPYCHAFESVVDRCYWNNHDPSWDGPPLAAETSFAHDFWFPLYDTVLTSVSPHLGRAQRIQAVESGHFHSAEDIVAHAIDTLQNSQADVIYIHFPVPHPPAAYDRHTHRFAVMGSYLDGLGFADDILGRVLDTIQPQPRWQHTTLIVQGDHGWRDWAGSGDFNEESRRVWLASPRDVHPLVLVHRAGQTDPAIVSQEISLLGTREVALSVVRQMHK